MAKSYFTSSDVIAAVKRKITFPTSQDTFTDTDILAFANDELMVSQVPSILEYHEEYFVTKLLEGGSTSTPLVASRSRYPIPGRAIGLRLRNIFYEDTGGNLFELSRISPDEQAFFQADLGTSVGVNRFYLEGNDVILVPTIGSSPSGNIIMSYYLRPNQLVENDRAAILTGFSKTITIDYASVVAGDTVTIDDEVFTAVAAAPSTDEFVIGASGSDTASNLANAIVTNGVASASATSAVITVTYTDRTIEFETDNEDGFDIQATINCVCTSVPSHLVAAINVDVLQTKPGHRTLALSIPILASSATSLTFTDALVPQTLLVGDYICQEEECIIPQIPTDLQNNLIERTCARILAAIGDYNGVQEMNSKIADAEKRQGSLIDNRTEGNPQKILARGSPLRYGKFHIFRRW